MGETSHELHFVVNLMLVPKRFGYVDLLMNSETLSVHTTGDYEIQQWPPKIKLRSLQMTISCIKVLGNGPLD